MGKGSVESRSKAQARYDKANCVYVSLKLNRKNDAEVIERLDCVSSKQRYLVNLVKEDISKNGILPTSD